MCGFSALPNSGSALNEQVEYKIEFAGTKTMLFLR